MKVSPDVISVLDRCEFSGTMLTLPRQLDRKDYLAVNKVIEAAGGKWNRSARAHLFADPAGDVIDQIILTGEIATLREAGYFPTPPGVLDVLVPLADLGSAQEVLEPSAGRGAIVKRVAPLVSAVDYIERDAGHAEATGHLGLTRHARIADFLTVDAPGWHECRCGWAYTSPEVLAGHWKVSTTSCGPSPKAPGYDRVVMNPPFAKQQDISHVEHALRFLRPGGLLVSVMTVGVKERLNAKAERFRKIVADRGGDFIPLPADSFREAGTGVHAVLAVIPERAR